MGAARVVLLGADFAYPGGTSHVSGAAHAQRVAGGEASFWVLDGHGRRIPTRADLRGFLRDLERYIQAHPQVTFLNASQAGARITGCLFLEAGEL
jgi:hypothetical protein